MLSIDFNSHIKSWRNQRDLERITKIKPFINIYNWERINCPSEKDNWEKFKKNNVTIALNILYTKIENISCLCFKTYF